MSHVQVYNGRIKRYVLMDDEKKSGIIECQKQPFEDVPFKDPEQRPQPQHRKSPQSVQNESFESDKSPDPESEKATAESKSRGGIFSFLGT